MEIRLASDIHLEFFCSARKQLRASEIVERVLPAMPNDADTYLVLAGDIFAEVTSHLPADHLLYETFIAILSARFKEIIYIAGNHEFYRSTLVGAMVTIKAMLHRFDNVHFLDNSAITFGDHCFIGGTGWTPLNDNYILDSAAFNGINDSVIIEGMTMPVWQFMHNAYLASIKQLFHENSDKIIISISHHLPSNVVVSEQYKDSPTQSVYVMDDVDDIIPDAALWLFGHTHDSFDGMLGDCRAVCNPYGYTGHMINPDYDNELVITC